MGRKRRTVEIGFPHHVAHRGNHRQTLFESDTDRRYYLALVDRYSRSSGTQIAGFCLMDNHVHFVAIPSFLKSLSECFGRAHRAYSEHLNRRRGAHGSNWEGRFYSDVMSEAHTINALVYIERNPVDAGMVASASDWEWSSARQHCDYGQRWPLVNLDVRRAWVDPCAWRARLCEPLSEEDIATIPWASRSISSGSCYSGSAA